MRRRSPRHAVLAAVLALVAAGCARAPQAPVERLLAAVEHAAEERDAAAVAAHLGADFRGRGNLDRASAETELRRYFALYEGVALEYADPQAETADGETRVTVRVLFSGKPRFGGRFGLRAVESAPFRFTLRCREEHGRLLVSQADWEEETPGHAPEARESAAHRSPERGANGSSRHERGGN